MNYLIAADTGGTFTDVAVYDADSRQVRYGKTLTDYDDLVAGALRACQEVGVTMDRASLFKHGTTHVINTLIERTGAKAALVTTRGFRDTVEIGRGNRPVPFALEYRRLPPLVPRERRYEVGGRIDAQGRIVEPLSTAELEQLAGEMRQRDIQAVAVSFINAYANPEHETQAVEVLRRHLPGVYVTCGTALTHEWFEYERASTAVANAYVGARMASYLSAFDAKLRERDFAGGLYMMGSNGGVLSVERSLAQPVALVESGPIGGCIGAAAVARALGLNKLIAFDMGGTTAKCALVQDAQFDVEAIYYVGGYDHGFPLKTPVVDIVEVGAGGGSIAMVDEFGRLQVGPRSAGSLPGPVAFARGGTEPTVTDANLVLGRIGSGAFLQGRLPLDRDAAARAIRERIAEPLNYDGESGVDMAALGILDLSAATMSGAIKEITIERGYDVREFALLVFGGGGPLFGTLLARTLRIPLVIVPPHPGNFSTLGMLLAGARLDFSRTLVTGPADAMLPAVATALTELRAEAEEAMVNELNVTDVVFDSAVEMRYRGQKHSVRIRYEVSDGLSDLIDRFEAVYSTRYGHINPGCAVEILGVRLSAHAGVPKPELAALAGELPRSTPSTTEFRSMYLGRQYGRKEVPVLKRGELPVGFRFVGPAVIEEYSATTVLMPEDKLLVGELGELRIECPVA